MKRKIKFRGLRIDTREWVYGDLLTNGAITHISNFDNGVNREHYEAISESVGQYTGLKDKNGVEIYEGDILKFADKWEWFKGKYGVKMFFATVERRKELEDQYNAEPEEVRIIEDMREDWLNSSEIPIYWEVIGNVHQNPELLEP